ncbi:MAG: DUF3604 domain-containing protein [Planctomycetota bacterium]|jgi:hypothetical protein
MNERFLNEGEFITLLGFEWQHTGFGDKVIHYLGGDQPYLPATDERGNTASRLYKTLRESDAFIIGHHPCYPEGSWCSSTDFDAVETDVERLVEIWSMHGSSEGYDKNDRPLVKYTEDRQAYAALKRGVRLGFTGGSDTHSGRPGGSAKEPRPYWGGCTGIWAENLTRQDIFKALYARRTYALTKERIVLKFKINDNWMGSEIDFTPDINIEIEAYAPGNISKVEIMKDCEIFKSIDCSSDTVTISESDKIAKPAFYHCRVTMADGNLAVCSPVWVG